MSNTEALPKLPEPARQVVYNEAKGYTFDAYTADQMREFGTQQFNAGREFERERRAALAQPAETDAELERRTGEPHVDGWPLCSGLPQPAASGEPTIHWPQVIAYPGGNGRLGAWVDVSTGDGPECVTRYFAAQPAPALVPLTDAGLSCAAGMEDNEEAFIAGFVRGARFAEQCHGIGTPAKDAPHAAPDAPQPHPQR